MGEIVQTDEIVVRYYGEHRYELEVTDQATGAVLWATGKVSSNRTAYVDA